MATDAFKLQAQWSTTPQDGGLLRSGAPPIGPTPISETVVLDAKNVDEYTLTSDSAQPIAFGGVVNANVVIISCDRPITVILTSVSGTNQVISIDDQLIILSRTTPYTAISVQRTPATLTTVFAFVGEKA